MSDRVFVHLLIKKATLVVAITVLGFIYLLTARPVQAETRTVTNTLDSGPGSLRQVVLDAGSGDTLIFDSSVFSVSLNITLTSQIEISHSMTMNGLTTNSIVPTLLQSAYTRTFQVDAGVTVTLMYVNITAPGFAYALPSDGAISNYGMLNIISSTLSGNGDASTAEGGGILNYGSLILISSNLNNNNAQAGGAISNHGIMTVTSSAIVGNWNYAVSFQFNVGGAIYNSGSLSIVSSDISHNTSCDGPCLTAPYRPTPPVPPAGVAGIYNIGALSILSSSLASNGGGAWGGALFNDGGVLTVADGLFTGNRADGIGAGISFGAGINNTGNMTVTRSVFSNNGVICCYEDGGAIFNSGSASVTNTTFNGNGSFQYLYPDLLGGAIFNQGTLMVGNSTLSGDSGTDGGGEIYSAMGVITLTNTIIAGSLAGDNCYGAVSDGGHNLDDGNTCGFTAAGSLTNTNPNLGPLQINPPGYAIPTMALLFGSPAIDAGDDAHGVCPRIDERGIHRPIGKHCDIGAYEAPVMVLLAPVMRQ